MENNGDLLLFLGKWHPLLVHLPIGMLLMAFVLAVLGRKKAYRSVVPAIAPTLLFGAASAVLAAFSGYLLSLQGGYDVRTLSLHRWIGLSAAGVSVLCWLLYRVPVGTKDLFSFFRNARFAVLCLMLVLLCVAGHFGGTLTHGDGYLSFGEPPVEFTVEDVQEAAVYADIVRPIFQQRCQHCHGPRKQEGELALHTFEDLMKGGESGQVVLAGDTVGSELFRRLRLPVGDEDRMPPKGRKPITDDQIRLIAWWIAAGAPKDKQVKELVQPDEIQPILLALEAGNAGSAAGSGSMDAYEDIPPANQVVVDQLIAKGMKVVPVAKTKNQLAVSAINDPDFNDDDCALLVELGANLAELKLGGTQITDAALGRLGTLTGLRKLHLDHTAITDAGIARLQELEKLWYLNLVHTQVTDRGLEALQHFPALRKVYLYQTGVTPDGVASLMQQTKTGEIDTGNYRLSVLPTDTLVY